MPVEPARIDPLTGRYLALDYATVHALYFGGVGQVEYDMAAFMNSPLAREIRPSDFSGLAEVLAFAALQQGSGSINIRDYFATQGAGLGLVGDDLDKYVNNATGYGYQSYFTSDPTEQGSDLPCFSGPVLT